MIGIGIKYSWCHWEDIDKWKNEVWIEIALAVLKSWSKKWEDRLIGEVKQLGDVHEHYVNTGPLRAAWIDKLKGMCCLPDEFDRLLIPAEIYRRTPDTLALLNVEPFIKECLDIDEYKNGLDALGVRSHPAGAKTLLERIKALSNSENPPLGPLRDLYRAVERVALRVSPEKKEEICESFKNYQLIKTKIDWKAKFLCFS